MSAFGSGPFTAEVLPPPERDNFGDPIAPAGPAREIPGCWVAPGDGSESTNREQVVRSVWTLYAPAGAAISARDRIRIPAMGITAEVDGPPQSWHGAGVVAALRRVTG